MRIQLEIVSKPELFVSDVIPLKFHAFFRAQVSFSFPSDINIDWLILGSVAKQIYIARMRQEMGDGFFEGKAPITTEFFDRWWIIKPSCDVQEEDLEKGDDEPAADALDRLERPIREQILYMQTDEVRIELQRMLELDSRPQGPEAGGLLYAETDYFKPFPEPETVFAEDVETHLKYLLPLATVSLEHINPAWEGPIHFVLPIEPYEGVVGELTSKHHSSLCGDNWIGYHIDKHGLYTFAAEWEFFLLKKLETRDDFQLGVDEEELKKLYEEARQSYTTNRKHFQEFGGLHPSYSLEEYGAYRDRDRHELVNQLGGKPGWGNWPEIGDWPLSEHYCGETDEFPGEKCPLPQAEDGTDFSYIGWLHSFVYVETSSCSLELFYHPDFRLALTTFDWS